MSMSIEQLRQISDADERLYRDHASAQPSIVQRGGRDEIAVGVSQREDSLGNMSAPVVDVYVSRDMERTPAEARKVGGSAPFGQRVRGLG